MRNLLNNKGATLTTVIIVFAFVMLTSATVLSITMFQSNSSLRYTDQVDAVHYAEAGINEYMSALNRDEGGSFTFNTDVAFEEGFYNLNLVSKTYSKAVVEATGWSKDGEERTIEAKLLRMGYTHFAFLSNATSSTLKDTMSQGLSAIYGPIHSNTLLSIKNKFDFYGHVTYSSELEFLGSGSSSTFLYPDEPQKISSISFPLNNSELKPKAQAGGYYFVGRTSIYLTGNNGDVNRKLVVQNANYNGGAVTELPMPANGVIYVDGLKDMSNVWRSPNKFNLDYGNLFITGVLDGKLTIGVADSIYITAKDPTNFDFASAAVPATRGITYNDTSCSINTTIHEVSCVGNDLLGLIANNNVWIMTDGWLSNTGVSPNYIDIQPDSFYADGTGSAYIDTMVHGSLFAVNYQIRVENQDDPNSRGLVTIYGSVIQGSHDDTTDGSQVAIQYAFDPRLYDEMPPSFPMPDSGAWDLREWKEIK